MKKNIFPFLPDENLLSDIECLLKFLRQPLPLDEFFKKFSSDILKARLDQLEFKFENRRSAEYFVIASKAKNKTNTIELTNNDLTCLGITITDPTHLINPLIDLQKTFPALNLKDALTKLITINNNKIKQIKIDEIVNILKNTSLNHRDDKNKQIEINLFFKFLKKLIVQQNDNFSFPIQPQTLTDFASAKIIDWLISEDEKSNVLGKRACYSKKHDEISALITKLDSFSDTKYLAMKLNQLNNQCLQQLLNINTNEEAKKVIAVIENFQCKAQEAINDYRQNNSLSLEQLNILHKILNVIAKLIPKFIVPKNTRVGFFQQYTPQNKLLVKLEETIQQPKL